MNVSGPGHPARVDSPSTGCRTGIGPAYRAPGKGGLTIHRHLHDRRGPAPEFRHPQTRKPVGNSDTESADTTTRKPVGLGIQTPTNSQTRRSEQLARESRHPQTRKLVGRSNRPGHSLSEPRREFRRPQTRKLVGRSNRPGIQTPTNSSVGAIDQGIHTPTNSSVGAIGQAIGSRSFEEFRHPQTRKLVGRSNRPGHSLSEPRGGLRPSLSKRPSCARDHWT